MLPDTGRTRGGQNRPPNCPHCGKRLRVKPAPRSKPVQKWQCAHCLEAKTRAPAACEWTNGELLAALPLPEETDPPVTLP